MTTRRQFLAGAIAAIGAALVPWRREKPEEEIRLEPIDATESMTITLPDAAPRRYIRLQHDGRNWEIVSSDTISFDSVN